MSIGEISSITGSAGGCTLNNISVGEQTITVTADGYEDYSENITISNENNSFNITLTSE